MVKETKSRRHACPQCDAAFGRASTLRKHVRTVHEQRKDHACPQCDAAFGEAGHLRRHVRSVHEQRRDHACPQCDAAFGEAGTLRRHVRSVHEQRKDHACPQCDAAFGKASDLSRHVRTVHEQRRDHACPQCDAAFGEAGSLRRHLRAMHEDVQKKSTCPTCNGSFKVPQHLGAHRTKARAVRNWSKEKLNSAKLRAGGASAILELGARSKVGGKELFAAPNIQAVFELVEWPTVNPAAAKLFFHTWMSERCWRETQPLSLMAVKTEEEE
jgi:KRAB domain-containing zinc finger protein